VLENLAVRLGATKSRIAAYPCDATDERSVIKLMRDIEAKLGVPEIVIYAVQGFSPGSLLTTEVAAFEECWRANCLGAFIVSREAARGMQPLGRGTILFAGATSGTVGRQGYVNLAVGKFGLRALSQVIARELGPQGIHVAHVLIDGDIAENLPPNDEPHIQPDQLAELFWSLHMQPRSCWTSELDVRPATERFWGHC
jgi:NAD(P)-dependent dehydrogenase (short-subunit alcohol dehydrogenase family)